MEKPLILNNSANTTKFHLQCCVFKLWCGGSMTVQVWQTTFICEQAGIRSVDLDLFVLLGLILYCVETKE